jgi:hypothetical protein
MNAIKRVARIAYTFVAMNGAGFAGLLALVQRRRVW